MRQGDYSKRTEHWYLVQMYFRTDNNLKDCRTLIEKDDIYEMLAVKLGIEYIGIEKIRLEIYPIYISNIYIGLILFNI